MLEKMNKNANSNKRPTKQECMEILGLTNFDIATLRSIKHEGVKKWCEDRLKVFEMNSEKKGDPKFSGFCSMSYNHFRNDYKAEGVNWREKTLSQLIESLNSQTTALKDSKNNADKIKVLCDILVLAFLSYRKLIEKDNV